MHNHTYFTLWGLAKADRAPIFFDFFRHGLNERYRYKTNKTFVGIEFWPNLSPYRPFKVRR